MPRDYLFAKNNVASKLAAPLEMDDLVAVLAPGQGDVFPSTSECPYHVTVSLPGNANIHEILRVHGREGDLLSITRGAEGSTPGVWPAQSSVELRQTAQHINDLNNAVKTLEWFISMAWGGGNGVIRYGAAPDDGLKVVPSGGLDVAIKPGAGFANNLMFRLPAQHVTEPLAVPSQDIRVDLVQANARSGEISIKQNVTGPEPEQDCLALALIYCRPAMIAIDATDNGTNGYIVDVRTFI